MGEDEIHTQLESVLFTPGYDAPVTYRRFPGSGHWSLNDNGANREIKDLQLVFREALIPGMGVRWRFAVGEQDGGIGGSGEYIGAVRIQAYNDPNGNLTVMWESEADTTQHAPNPDQPLGEKVFNMTGGGSRYLVKFRLTEIDDDE